MILIEQPLHLISFTERTTIELLFNLRPCRAHLYTLTLPEKNIVGFIRLHNSLWYFLQWLEGAKGC